MNNTNTALEKKALNFSVFLVSCTAVWAIIMTVYTQSLAVLLDAAFSVLSAILSALGAITVHFMSKGFTKRHPMGFYSYEALISLLRSLCLIGMMGYLFYDAVHVILQGGKEIPTGAMLVYTIPAVITCLAGFIFMGRIAGKVRTMTLEADLNEWRLSFFIAAAIFCALIISIAFKFSPWPWLALYTDPGVVIFLCVILMKDPLMLVGDSFRHLMLQSATPEYAGPFRKKLRAFIEKNAPEFSIGYIDIIPVGRMVWVLTQVSPRAKNIPAERIVELEQSIKDMARKQFTHSDSLLYFSGEDQE